MIKLIDAIYFLYSLSYLQIVIAGLSNVYSHYMVTYEEYQGQRYEGASTLFGPHTHAAYVQRFTDIVGKIVAGDTGKITSVKCFM